MSVYRCPKCGSTLEEEKELEEYQFVCAHCDENFYKFEAVKCGYEPMRDEKLRLFVENQFELCLQHADLNVKRLYYAEDYVLERECCEPVKYSQVVIIEFENGYRKYANVVGDSPLGAMHDVLRAIER